MQGIKVDRKSILVVVIAALTLVAGCNSKGRASVSNGLLGLPAPVIKVLRELESRPFVKSMGHAGAVVYLDKRNGHPIDAGGTDRPEDNIRLMIRTGKIPDAITHYETNAKFVRKSGGYSRYAAINGSLSRNGLVVFESCDGHLVYSEQRSRVDNGSGWYTGFMRLADGLFAEYSYFSGSLDQHKKINEEVCLWLKRK